MTLSYLPTVVNAECWLRCSTSAHVEMEEPWGSFTLAYFQFTSDDLPGATYKRLDAAICCCNASRTDATTLFGFPHSEYSLARASV